MLCALDAAPPDSPAKTCNFLSGLVVPIPTLPSSLTLSKSVPLLSSTSRAVVADVVPAPFTCSSAVGVSLILDVPINKG